MSLLLLFHGSPPAGPVSGDLAITESSDVLSASSVLPLNGSLTPTEADDVGIASGTLTVAASVIVTEGDDACASGATVALVGGLAAAEGDDVPAAGGRVDIVASIAVSENSDALATQGAIGVKGELSAVEGDDALSASALMPIFYPRRGGGDLWAKYEQRQIEWGQQLSRIIDRSWRIAHGEIDPVTLLPVPPPDYSPVTGELINRARALDQTRVEAFIAEQKRQQEEDAISILLLVA